MAGSDSRFRLIPVTALLGDISPEALTEFLRVWNSIRESVLQGFRLHPKAVKSQAVLQRLERELDRDHEALSALIELWQLENLEYGAMLSSLTVEQVRTTLPNMVKELGRRKAEVLLSLDERSSIRALAKQACSLSVPDEAEKPRREPERAESPPPKAGPEAELARLRRQSERLEQRVGEMQREVAALRSEAQSASRAEGKARAEAAATRKEIEEQQRALDRTARRAERAEKQRDDLEAERSGLVHDLRALRRAKPAPAAEAELPAPRKLEDVWPEALDRLFRGKRYEAVLQFCEAMGDADPGDPRPRMTAVRAARALKDGQRVLDDCRWLSAHFTARKQWAKAAYYACVALAQDAEFAPVREDLRLVLRSISLKNERQVAELRHVFVRLRASSPDAHRVVGQILKDAGRDHAKALAVQTPGFPLDRTFNLDIRGKARAVTLRRLIACMNGNREAEVAAAKEGLTNLQRSRPELRNEIREALEGVDPGYETVLAGPTNPVVVDGSNVAFLLQTQSGKPRLQNISFVRRALRELRYWPILILCDAALQYQIDRASEFGTLVDTGEVTLADPRTDADEQLIARAKERACALVTNDQMLDWDPVGEVPKLRFNVYDDRAVIFGRIPIADNGE